MVCVFDSPITHIANATEHDNIWLESFPQLTVQRIRSVKGIFGKRTYFFVRFTFPFVSFCRRLALSLSLSRFVRWNVRKAKKWKMISSWVKFLLYSFNYENCDDIVPKYLWKARLNSSKLILTIISNYIAIISALKTTFTLYSHARSLFGW